MANIQFNPEKNIQKAISPYSQYCDGFKSPGASGGGYINNFILSIGKTSIDFFNDGSDLVNNIVAYDNAEIETAYIGQINMTIVSSFSGPNGLIWGYDLARPENLKEKHPLTKEEVKGHKGLVNIYNISLLLEATKSLFGSNKSRHFPLLPGAHVPCAGRFIIQKGPCHIYSAMSISIPKDRSHSASLLMEDVGLFQNHEDITRKEILDNLIKSALVIGKNQDIDFQNIFVGIEDKEIKEDEVACAMVVMPYFSLAQKALIGEDPRGLLDISLKDWETQSKDFFLK